MRAFTSSFYTAVLTAGSKFFGLLVILLMLSCKNGGGNGGGGGAGETPPGGTTLVTKSLIIGSEGGEIVANDGSWKLTVPQFALRFPQEIKVTVDAVPVGTVGSEFKKLTKVYKFEPSGLFFDRPAKFWFKYEQTDMAENGLQEKMIGIYYVNDDSSLEKAPSTINAALNEATSDLRHFSFGIGLTIQVFLVNAGIITNATPVLNIANAIIAHFAALADDAARQAEYLSQQALIDAFITKTEQILGYNPLFQAFPGIFPPGTTGGYSITYAANGAASGSVPTDNTKYASGASVTVLANTGSLLRTNYTFVGWNTAADGSGTTYTGGAAYTMPAAHVTLYARWVENPKYTITYFGNGSAGGTVPLDAGQYYAGTSVLVAFNSGGLYKSAELFSGWNTQADGNGASYAAGQALIIGSVNLNLYATWQSRFTRMAGASAKPTRGQGVAVDKDGNFFVVGYSDGNLNGVTINASKNGFLIKYNRAGVIQWTRLIDAGTSATNALGVVTDNAGNIYISGTTQGMLDSIPMTGIMDTYLIKYDTNGTRLWARLLGVAGAQTYSSFGPVLAIDASGNLYISGVTNGNLGGQTKTGLFDAFVAKYAPDGTLIWVRLSGVAATNTNGFGIAADSAGNIFTVGSATGNLDGQTKTGTADAYLIKYDTNGVKQWTRLTGAISATTWVMDVKTDQTGNAYMAGYSTVNIDGQIKTGTVDAMLTKFDASGVKQWTRLHGVAGAATNATSLTVDPFDQIYLCGATDGNLDGQIKAGTSDTFLTKYDSAGTKKYTRLLGVTGVGTAPFACTSDVSGNISTTGYTKGNLDGQTLTGTEDMFVTNNIMDSSSNVANTVTYNGNGNTSGTVPTDTGIYLHGAPVLVKGNTGDLRRTNHTNLGWNSQADGSGSVRMPGKQFSMGPASETIYAAWRTQWTRLSGTTGAQTLGTAIATDNQDNSYTGGVAYSNLEGQTKTGLTDGYLEKFDKNGAKLWTRLLGQANTHSQLVDVAVIKQSGFVIAAGSRYEHTGSTWYRVSFISRYYTDGSPYASPQQTSIIGSTSGDTYATGMAIDVSGNQYIAGMTNQNLDGETRTGSYDGYVSKYDVFGMRQWTRLFAAPSNNIYVSGITQDNNQVYIVGYVYGDIHGQTNPGYYSTMVIAFDLNGNRLWTRLLGGTGVSGARTHTVALGAASTNCSGVYVTGYTYSNFGNAGVTPSNQYMAFIFGYDSSGTPIYPAATMPVSWFLQGGYTYGQKIACDTNGKVHVLARAYGAVNGVSAPGSGEFALLYAPHEANSADRYQWLGVAGSYTYGAGLGFDSRGVRYIAGYTYGNLDGQTKTGSYDAFVSTRLNK